MSVLKWAFAAFMVVVLAKVAWVVALKDTMEGISERRYTTPAKAKNEILNRAGDSLSEAELRKFKHKKLDTLDDLREAEGSVNRLDQLNNKLENLRGVYRSAPPAGNTSALAPQARPAADQLAKTKEFRVMTSNDNVNEYEYQLDGRSPSQELKNYSGNPLIVSDGDVIEFWAYGAICAPSVRCTGPNGQGSKPGDLSPEDWIRQGGTDGYLVSGAKPGSACAYIGNHSIQVGSHYKWEVPAGTGKQNIMAGGNLRINEFAQAKEGHVLKIKITEGKNK